MNTFIRVRQAGVSLLLWSLFAYCWLALTSAVLSWARAPFTLQYDMNVYHVVGREWLLHGVVPYRDLIDIKGPLTFLEYGLGAWFTPFSLSGTAVVHSLAAGTALFFAWKSALLFMKNRAAITLTIALSTVIATFYGNPSETVLAFQMAALYLFLRQGRLGGHPPLFAYGVLMGAAIAVKYNLAAFFVPFVAIALWRQAQEGGLRRAARGLGRCMGGAACVLVPFAAYFAWQGALDDLWRYYFLAGFRYGALPLSTAALFHPDAAFLGQFTPGYLRFDKILPPSFFIMAGIVFQLGGLLTITFRRHARLPHNRDAAVILWASWALSLFAVFRGPYAYYHYFVSFLPFAFLTVLTAAASLARLWRIRARANDSSVGNYALWVVPFLLAGVLLAHMADLARGQFAALHRDDAAQIEAIRALVSSRRGDAPILLTLHPYVAVFHRLSPYRPANRNAFPQMTTKGRANWTGETFSLLEHAVPRYVLAITDASGAPRLDEESEYPAVSEELLNMLERRYRLKKIVSFARAPGFQYVGVFERKEPRVNKHAVSPRT